MRERASSTRGAPRPWGAWGEALLNSDRPEEAERALRAALQLRPDATSKIALGYALLRQSQPEPALALFREVLTQAPRTAAAIHGAGAASEALGRPAEAIEHYRRLMALSAQEIRGQQAGRFQQDAGRRLVELTKPAERGRRSSASPAGVR